MKHLDVVASCQRRIFRVAALCAILVSNTTDRKLDCSTWHHDDNNREIRKAQLGSAVFLGRPISSKLWIRIRPQLFAWDMETTGAVDEKQKFLQITHRCDSFYQMVLFESTIALFLQAQSISLGSIVSIMSLG